jgi:hypothetical protein
MNRTISTEKPFSLARRALRSAFGKKQPPASSYASHNSLFILSYFDE